MNVLETLKINNATVLNVKDGDILVLKCSQGTTCSDIEEVTKSVKEALKKKGLKDIQVWATKGVEDIKIIRR